MKFEIIAARKNTKSAIIKKIIIVRSINFIVINSLRTKELEEDSEEETLEELII